MPLLLQTKVRRESSEGSWDLHNSSHQFKWLLMRCACISVRFQGKGSFPSSSRALQSHNVEIKFEHGPADDERLALHVDIPEGEDFYFGSETSLTGSQQMAAENTAETFDITQYLQ